MTYKKIITEVHCVDEMKIKQMTGKTQFHERVRVS